MSILSIELSQKPEIKNEDIIKMKAYKEGYDLTNPNDNFYLDICLPYSYDSKDVTLEYRQKYFYFPKKEELKNIKFQQPIRNNTYHCFSGYFQFKYLYKNISFLFQFPLFIFELLMLLITLYLYPDGCFSNTPAKQIDIIKKEKCFLHKNIFNEKENNKSDSFATFVGEGTINDTDIKNINTNNDAIVQIVNKNDINKSNDDIDHRNSQDSNNDLDDNKKTKMIMLLKKEKIIKILKNL